LKRAMNSTPVRRKKNPAIFKPVPYGRNINTAPAIISDNDTMISLAERTLLKFKFIIDIVFSW
jgi:hypothetical protein